MLVIPEVTGGDGWMMADLLADKLGLAHVVLPFSQE